MPYKRERDLPRANAKYAADPQKYRDRKNAAYVHKRTPEQRAAHAEYMRRYYAEHPGYKSAADKKHRAKYLAKYLRYDKWRRQTPERKAQILTSQKKRYAAKKDEILAYSKAYYRTHKDKWEERAKKRRERPVEVKRLEHRKASLKYRHGMTLDQYDAMLSAQGGVCAICGDPPTVGHNKRLHVDHDHKTEVRRGLLCMHCNHAIERLDKYPDWHEKAVAYLKRSQ